MKRRQYTDSFNSLVSLWYKPGSTVVARGFVVTNAERGSILHHSSQCVQVWTQDLRTETVFNHPSIGDYTLSPDGIRNKFTRWCNACDPSKAVLERKPRKRDRERAARRLAVEESRRVRSSAFQVSASTNE